MEKYVVSALLAILGGAAVVGGIHVRGRSEQAVASSAKVAGDLSALREELSKARAEARGLADELRRLDAAQAALATRMDESAAAAVVPAVANAGSASPASALSRSDLKALVFAAIEEDRKVRQGEQQQQRDEMRQRMDERRKEMAALGEGPYDRFNFKVNSMAKALELTDAQKQAYYELSKQYSEKFDEARKTLAAQAGGGQPGAPGAGGPGGGRGRGDRGQFRELMTSLQQEYDAAVQGILTTEQAQTYAQLPEQTRGFQSQGNVAGGGGPAGRFQGMGGGSGQRGAGRTAGGRGR